MKTCNKCNQTKPLTEFYKDKTKNDGLHSICKECEKEYYQINKERRAEYHKELYQLNKERIAKRRKKHYQLNKERRAEYHKEYYQINKDRITTRNKEYKQINKERIAKRRKKYYQLNKERRAEYNKELYQLNKERRAEYQKEHYQLNKDRITTRNKEYKQNNKERLTEYRKNRLQTDELYKATTSIRRTIGNSIRRMGYTKRSKTQQILGCSFEEFKLHIENQFAPGMSWDNRDHWHLDHKDPISLATTEEEVIRLNHYKNFQPLWAEDNRSKGNKTDWVKDPTKYNTP